MAVPRCVLDCFVNASSVAADCANLATVTCICYLTDSLGNYLRCLRSSCSEEDQITGVQWVQDQCAEVGMELNVQITEGLDLEPTVPVRTGVDPMTMTRAQVSTSSENSTSAGTSSSPTPTPVPVPVSLSSATPSTDTSAAVPASPPSLSTGAQAGIATGGIVLGILVTLCFLFLWRRKRRLLVHQDGKEDGTDKELVTESTAMQMVYYEMDGRPIHTEMDENPNHTELEDRHAAHIAREREGRSELTAGL